MQVAVFIITAICSEQNYAYSETLYNVLFYVYDFDGYYIANCYTTPE